MRAVSLPFRQIEEHHARGQLAHVANFAERLATNVNLLHEMTGELGPARAKRVEQHVDRIRAAALELRAMNDQSTPSHAASLIEMIRQSCVECHISFRDIGEGQSFYPAKGNTVIADVSLLTSSNQERSDRSNVVVFLDGIRGSAGHALPGTNPRISQTNRSFSPRVLAIVKGTTVDFPNDDSILHNVFSLSKARRFDLDVYPPGKSKSVTFRKPGLVKLYCNIHPEMASSILVLNNPYFALTDSAGHCVISGIPNGTPTLRTWHEFGGEFRQQLSLTGNTVVRVPLRLREERQAVPHRNKHGQPYTERAKY